MVDKLIVCFFSFLKFCFLVFEVLQRDEQLIACSDLIEFDSYKENTIEGNLSLTIQLTRSFNFNHQSNEDLQKRQRKAQS